MAVAGLMVLVCGLVVGIAVLVFVVVMRMLGYNPDGSKRGETT